MNVSSSSSSVYFSDSYEGPEIKLLKNYLEELCKIVIDQNGSLPPAIQTWYLDHLKTSHSKIIGTIEQVDTDSFNLIHKRASLQVQRDRLSDMLSKINPNATDE